MRVLIAVTTYKCQQHPMSARGLGAVMAYTAREHPSVELRFPPLEAVDGLGTDTRRNEAIRHARGLNLDAVFFLDADTEPPPDALAKLLAADVHIATGLVALRRRDRVVWVVRHMGYTGWLPIPDDADGLIGGGAPLIMAGAACLLIRRDVWQAIPAPWFQREEENDNTGGRTGDIYFWENAKRAGFLGWAHCGVRCKHWDGHESYPPETRDSEMPNGMIGGLRI